MDSYEEMIIPEVPKALPSEQLFIYAPIASDDTLGVAKFDNEYFSVDVDGTVHLRSVGKSGIITIPASEWTDAAPTIASVAVSGVDVGSIILMLPADEKTRLTANNAKLSAYPTAFTPAFGNSSVTIFRAEAETIPDSDMTFAYIVLKTGFTFKTPVAAIIGVDAYGEGGGTGGGVDSAAVEEIVTRLVPGWARQENPPPYPVTSVNSKTGEVSLTAGDVGADPDGSAEAVAARVAEDLRSYYTKTEVNGLVSAIPKFSIEAVDSLPTSGMSSTTVYLVKDKTSSGDLYTEYIYVGGAWEELGRQTVNLSGYVTSAKLTEILSDYATKTSLSTAINTALAQAKASGEFDGKSAYEYAKDGGYAGTEAEFAEKLAKNYDVLLAEKVAKTGISLGIASDGLIYIFVDGTPVGTGVPQGQSGDVFGYVDENNTVVLTGNLANGTYTIKYEVEDSEGNIKVINIGDMVLDSNVYYSVTESLTNCVNSNTAKTVASGDSYTATITANSGYTLSSVTVTMGGSAVSVTGGAINIASVTGDIVITAVAEEVSTKYTNWIKEVGYTTGERLSASAGTTTTNGAEGCETTGYIPAKPGDILRIKNITTGSDTKNIFLYFNGSKEKLESAHTADIFVADEGNGVYASNALRNVVGTEYIRFTSENIGDTSIVTVNEEIV